MPEPDNPYIICPEHGEVKGHCPCTEPDWDHECMNCGDTPVVPITGLCGPCTFGEAETVRGNW